MREYLISYKKGTLSYRVGGKGETIVFLHGFLENQKMWDTLSSHFNSYQCITVDLLGHGQSDCIGYIHTMEDMADAVHHILNELKITQATFIGHSMGGYVALAFAELFPEMTQKIVLLNSTSRADSEERKSNRNRAILAVKQNYKAAISMSISNLFYEENRLKFKNEINHTRDEALKTPLQGIVAAQEGMKIRKDREIILHTWEKPILLILGIKDPVLNFEEHKNQIKNTNTSLISLSGGHMSHIENLPELIHELKQFL